MKQVVVNKMLSATKIVSYLILISTTLWITIIITQTRIVHGRSNTKRFSRTTNETTNDDNDGSSFLVPRDNRISITSWTDYERESGIRCGRSIATVNTRIVGGRTASAAEYPWLVSLQLEKRYWFGFKAYYHSCGGSLITGSWIVTAAHCVKDRNEKRRVVAGADDLGLLYKSQFRTVVQAIVHPDYDSTLSMNDIALLKVNRPFEMTSTISHVGPICLERNIAIPTYDIVTVAGYGASAYGEQSNLRLTSADIAVIDPQTCNRSFDYTIYSNMICAGGMVRNGRDACSGDSGGPLQKINNGHATLIGIVSFGNECSTTGFPGIYTKVSTYYDWIVQKIDEKLFPL